MAPLTRAPRSWRLAAALLPLALAAAACSGDGPTVRRRRRRWRPSPSPSAVPTTPPSAPAPAAPARPGEPVVLASGLAAPWGLAFLPDGDALVSERDTGRVLRVPAQGGDPVEVARIAEAAPAGEGGLLGLAIGPTYARDGPCTPT